MANPEDFEIVPQEDSNNSLEPRRLWLWGGGLLVLFVCAFAVGVGWLTWRARIDPGTATAVPVVVVTGGTPAAGTPAGGTPAGETPAAGMPAGETPAGETPAGETPAAGTPAGETPAGGTPAGEMPAAVPTRVCTEPLDSQLVALFDPGLLGCPIAPIRIVWAAYEPFERGAMLWRSDNNLTYLMGAEGNWVYAEEAWDGRELAGRGQPPAGLVAPQRGFGYVWEVRDEVFAQLGWAVAPEKGFCAALQSFERGFAFVSAAVSSCTAENLYNHVFEPGWQPLLYAFGDSGRWRKGVGDGGTAPLPPTLFQTPTVEAPATTVPVTTVPATTVPVGGERPFSQGNFVARRGQPEALDGQFGDWPDQWFLLTAIVQGQEHWQGSGDLGAKFQGMWAPEGLYLAVVVEDDRLQVGPDGSNLWQGDGIEIQFDRLLDADFAESGANDDDTQIGLAPDAMGERVRGYRWLPRAGEAPVDALGGVAVSVGQYGLELLVPWLYFDISGSDLREGMRFGFNIAVNDNDGVEPAQQSVLSASPARTTFDNPTEWGTLVLGK